MKRTPQQMKALVDSANHIFGQSDFKYAGAEYWKQELLHNTVYSPHVTIFDDGRMRWTTEHITEPIELLKFAQQLHQLDTLLKSIDWPKV